MLRRLGYYLNLLYEAVLAFFPRRYVSVAIRETEKEPEKEPEKVPAKKTLDFKLNTLIFIAGPSGAGKSTLAKLLQAKLQAALVSGFKSQYRHFLNDHIEPNVAILSSDDMRHELLGYPYHKHAPIMLQPSRSAFELLHFKCAKLMQWPVTAQFIIVDATNLAEGNRKAFLAAAKANHYSSSLVVLDYKDMDEFEKHLDFSLYSRKVIHNQIRKLHKDFYPGVKRKDYTDIYKLRRKDFSNIEVNIPHVDVWQKTWFPDNVGLIIPDIHGCFTEFKQVLKNSGYEIENGKLIVPEDKKHDLRILLGDLIDKGPETPELLDFLYENLEHFIVVEGNHENFIDRWFKGKVDDGSIPQEILDKYFTCTHELKDDPDRFAKFSAILKTAVPFVRTKSFFACHAPCEDKYLGKIDLKSIGKQRNFRIPRQKETYDETRKFWESELGFWFGTAESCHPWQFAGHIPLGRIHREKNKFLLDGGCPNGGTLNHAKVVPGYRCFVNRVPKQTPTPDKEKLIVLFPEPKRLRLKSADMDDDGLRRLRWAATHKINFISGTMSPAEKDESKNELESLEQGLLYYKSKGIKSVILQHKYMGSRANLYLNQKTPEESFAVSRGGFKIRNAGLLPDLEKLFATEIKRIEGLHPVAEWVILDGELLPWFALGRGLIEQTFKPIGHALQTEHDYLVNSGFEKLLGHLEKEITESGFKKEVSVLKKADMIEKYGQNIHSKYKGFANYNHTPLEELKDKIDVYKKQIELYGLDTPMHFKGFAALKSISETGEEKLFFDCTNEEAYKLTGNQDPYLIVDLDGSWEEAEAFYRDATVEKRMEGVVIKPEKVYTENVAPYLKVRNHDYLTIIYGYDFKQPAKYDKLLRQKSTHRKIQTSITEFLIGKKMLEIPRAEISLDNEAYGNLVAQMINEEKNEASLDPRL